MSASSRIRLAVLVLIAAARAAVADDALAPSVPTGLRGTTVNCSRIDLAWDASTDAGGAVAGYRVYRNGFAAALTSTPSAIQSALAASSTYSFAVSAVDTAGNESARTTSISVTTPACPDRTAPTTPTGLTAASSASCNRIDLAWNISYDVGGSGLRGYRVYRNGAFAMEVAAPSTLASDVGLDGSTTYVYAVSAIDGSGNESAVSLPSGATTAACLVGTPAVPLVAATAVGCNHVAIAWSSPAAPGATDAALYQVYRNGLFFTQVGGTTTAVDDTTAVATATYSYTVVAIDSRGARSADSNPAIVQTPVCPDTTPPSSPPSLGAVAVGCDRIQLAWGASTDAASGLAGYAILRDGVLVNLVGAPGTTLLDVGLAASTRYAYSVFAVDRAGNRSAPSSVAAATTPACANLPPVADAGPDRSTRTLTAVAFSGAGSVDPDGSITAWSWSFGDGVVASGVSPSHTYARAGTYVVTLTVTDDGGQTDTDTAVVSVAGRAPTAAAGPDRTVNSGDLVRFDGSASTDPDGSIVSYGWSFGDGTSAAGVAPTHSFAHPGMYAVTLTVTDDTGLAASDSATVQVLNRAPIAAAGPDRTATVGTAVAFDGRASSDVDGTITSFTWSFGDGQTATGATVSHAYAAPGTYVASLTVTDDRGAVGTDTAIVTVTGPVIGNAGPWVKQIGGVGYDETRAVAIDANDDVLVTGQTTGPFDLGNGVLCDNSIFVGKYSSAGTLLWAHCFGGDAGGGSGRAVAVDAAGNVAVTGYFRGTVDLGGVQLASPGGFDGFVAKYTARGTLLWSRQFGAPLPDAIPADSGNGVAIDDDGSIVVTGAFETPTDLGGGVIDSAGQTDAFVVKYGPAGQYLWAHHFGGLYADVGNAVALNANGDVFVTGTFYGPTDFGSGPLPSSSFDVFLAAYSAGGAPLWSEHFGGTLADEGKALAIDAAGNILVGGTFANTIDLGSGPLVSAGGNDGFLAKYTPTGAPLWSLRLGGLSSFDAVAGVTVDGTGQVAITGFFSRTVDFGGVTLTSAGTKDLFVARYTPLGSLLSAQRWGGASIDQGLAIAVDHSGALVVAGSFLGSADFGSGLLTSAGEADALLIRLVP